MLTGIFKKPKKEGITLKERGVFKDAVIDRRYHGGYDKAVYLYSSDHYPYWRAQYPDLSWKWGMFGENLTIEGMDEIHLYPGDQFAIGEEAIIEITTPREPCYKLGYRFKDPSIVKKFMQKPFSGTYARVIREGHVRAEDEVRLIAAGDISQSIAEIYMAKMLKKSERY